MASEITRRSFVRVAGAVGLLALVPPARLDGLLSEALAAGQPGRFLNAHEMDTLRALCDRLIPGPPEDPDAGALDAHVPEAIDLLLGAFAVKPPLIHAGGPYSNRAGSGRDDFAHFVPLDRHAELGWRIRLEGSRGMREREFAGPVRGLQQVYREGLAHLDERSRSTYVLDFATIPAPARDLILSDQGDDRVQELVGAAFANALEAMYGPPEYGGNRNLVGWGYTKWPGDRQPDGYTAAHVSGPSTSARKLDASALASLDHYLPALAGHRPPREAFWRRRRRLLGP
jgi:hypothetical protein